MLIATFFYTVYVFPDPLSLCNVLSLITFLIQNDNICIKNNIVGRKYVQTATFTIFVMSSIFEKNFWQEADIKCVHSNIDWLIYNTYPPDTIGVCSSLLMD